MNGSRWGRHAPLFLFEALVKQSRTVPRNGSDTTEADR